MSEQSNQNRSDASKHVNSQPQEQSAPNVNYGTDIVPERTFTTDDSTPEQKAMLEDLSQRVRGLVSGYRNWTSTRQGNIGTLYVTLQLKRETGLTAKDGSPVTPRQLCEKALAEHKELSHYIGLRIDGKNAIAVSFRVETGELIATYNTFQAVNGVQGGSTFVPRAINSTIEGQSAPKADASPYF